MLKREGEIKNIKASQCQKSFLGTETSSPRSLRRTATPPEFVLRHRKILWIKKVYVCGYENILISMDSINLLCDSPTLLTKSTALIY